MGLIFSFSNLFDVLKYLLQLAIISAMSDYENLFKIINKELISMKELRVIMDDEHVVSVVPSSTKKMDNSYDIKLDNDELYIVKVKEEFKGIFTYLGKKLHKSKKKK